MSDERIIELYRSGMQEEAFRCIVDAYTERLYWHIRRLVVSHEDARDLLQDTFLQAFRSMDQLRDPGAVKSWLYRIATNETITFIERNSRAVFEDIDTAATAIAADEWFDGDHLQARLQAAVQTLPPKQRMIFNMKYFEEMKYEDISNILGTSVGALKASYHLAVKKVSSFFDDDI